jgi:hypothetical protein
MSRPSPSTDAGALPRLLRALGVVALLVVQGSCALVVDGVRRLARTVERPSREARHAAAIGGAAPGPILPAVRGYVDHFDDDAIAVMTVQRLARVRFDRHTVFRTPDGPARVSDVRPAASVAVAGEPDADGTILADVVVIRPPE